MRKPIEIYAFAVCFVTILWFIISFTMAANDIVDLAFPKLMIADEYNAAAVDALMNSTQTAKSSNDKLTAQEKTAAQAKELAEKERKRQALQVVRQRSTIRNLIHELISLAISGLIFVFHWRLGRSEKFAQ